MNDMREEIWSPEIFGHTYLLTVSTSGPLNISYDGLLNGSRLHIRLLPCNEWYVTVIMKSGFESIVYADQKALCKDKDYISKELRRNVVSLCNDDINDCHDKIKEYTAELHAVKKAKAKMLKVLK